MATFLLRFIIFIGLWVLMVYDANVQLVFSLFMLTISLTIFFFLSNVRASVYLYGILVIVIFIHGILIDDFIFTSLLVLLVVIIGVFRLTKMKTYILLGTTYLLFMIFTILQNESILICALISGMYLFLLVMINQLTLKNEQMDKHVEKLNAEYRQLKRIQVSMDEIARNEERTRIAREIHDSVGHQLTALIMKLEMLHIQKSFPEFVELKAMANKSLAETRQAVQTLQETDSSGITAVIQLIRKLEAESQLLIQFTLREGVLSVPMSNKNGVVLYRVIQEALTNVMRHSDSKLVSISMGKSAINSLTFTIMNPVHHHKNFVFGFGLNNMQSRVREISGTIDIFQTKDQFVVQGMIPFA